MLYIFIKGKQEKSELQFQIQDSKAKYRIVSKELAVAAVAVLPVFLVGGRGGAGAPLRAAIFILALLHLWRWVAQRPIRHFVPFTCLVPKKQTDINISEVICFLNRHIYFLFHMFQNSSVQIWILTCRLQLSNGLHLKWPLFPHCVHYKGGYSSRQTCPICYVVCSLQECGSFCTGWAYELMSGCLEWEKWV